MTITYSVVWVSPQTPDIVEDVYGDLFGTYAEAEKEWNRIKAVEWDTDGLDWFPRIMRITSEFV